ncbi:MAG: CpaF family protein [Lachnospiraceae bacterium]|nr:CpaF family protein [Lachnospiraceae bacterium]
MVNDITDLKKELQNALIDRIDYSKDTSDEELYELIDGMIISDPRVRKLNVSDRELLRKKLFHALRKLDILQELVDDSTVTEIMINGPETIFIEKSGKLMRYPMQFESREKLEDVIQQIVSGCNRVVNEANPIVDARLENGSRVNIVLAPVALNGPIVTIRRFPDKPISMEDLIRFGSLRAETAGELADLVKARYNIFISGGTGSGKTTFLNALSAYIPRDERIITIEDNAELQILDLPNLVKLETRNANVEGCREISIRDLIKSSLRMRPDRVIVGEVRGGEAFDMMQAMNTGHDGSMSTGHANSCKDMLSRLENMILMGMELPLGAIRRQIASGIDLVIHLGRLRDRSRRVLEITEIIDNGTDEIGRNILYRFKETGVSEQGRIIGELIKENELICTDKLYAAGIRS